MRSTPSELSMQCPPSTPISEAILPALWMRTMSSAVRASSKVVGVGLDHPVDDVDLLERHPDGRVPSLRGDAGT